MAEWRKGRPRSKGPIPLGESLTILRRQLDLEAPDAATKVRQIISEAAGEVLQEHLRVGEVTSTYVRVVVDSSHALLATKMRLPRIKSALRESGIELQIQISTPEAE